jgi:hypothetical protein
MSTNSFSLINKLEVRLSIDWSFDHQMAAEKTGSFKNIPIVVYILKRHSLLKEKRPVPSTFLALQQSAQRHLA